MLKKIFICITLLCFSAQNIAAAVPIYLDNVQPALSKKIFIPESFGVIEKSSLEKYPSSKFVVVLKDAHCNYDAQQNIAKILEVLVKEYKIDLVAMEGAVGDLDYSRFDKMDNEDAREKMADSFVKKGVLAGPEYLKIARDGKLSFNVYGIENEKLYVENFIAFRDTINNQGETLIFINELSRVTKNLKSTIYQKELFEFDNKSMQYNENAISLTDWIKELKAETDKSGIILKEYPNIALTLDSIALEEKIDFKKVETERAEAINNLGKVLPKDKLKEMIGQSLQFRLGKISSEGYYEYLEQLLKSLSGINAAEKYSNLVRYIQLVKLQAWINNNALFGETAKLEDAIKQIMFQNNTQRQLDDISKKARILNGLFNLALNRDDLLYYRNHKSEFMPDSMISFINIQAPLNNIPTSMILNNKEFLDKVSIVIADGEKFYDIALQRDVSLVENTLRVMEERNKLNAVMVLGGFHTEGVLNLFEKKGVGYAVITPKIVTADKEGLYLSLMMDKRIQPKTETSSLALPEMFAGGKEMDSLRKALGAVGMSMELIGAAELLYNKLLGRTLKGRAPEAVVVPFNIGAGGVVTINPDFTSNVPSMVMEWLRSGLEEVLKAKPGLAEFVAAPGNLQTYFNKTFAVEYEQTIGDARQQGVLRNASLGFILFYLAVCMKYDKSGFLSLSDEDKRFMPEVIKELEAGKGYKWPKFRDELIKGLETKGLGNALATTIVNYLLLMLAYVIDEGVTYQTLFFNSYLRIVKDIGGKELSALLDKLQVYRYLQALITKGENEPLDEKDIIRKYGSTWAEDKLSEAKAVTVKNEKSVSDPIKRDVYVAALTRTTVASDVDKLDAPRKYETAFNSLFPKPVGELRNVEGSVMIRDCSLYVTNIEDNKYSDLSSLGLDSIEKMQKAGVIQYYLYETDKQKALMKEKLDGKGIKYTEDNFVTEYAKVPVVKGKVRVALLSNRLKEIAGDRGDRLLIGDETGSDIMLMDRAAFSMLGVASLDEEGIKDIFKPMLTMYYGGAYSEEEIERFLKNIAIGVDGVIKILLPPITPFVREYYDTLMKSREVIAKAA